MLLRGSLARREEWEKFTVDRSVIGFNRNAEKKGAIIIIVFSLERVNCSFEIVEKVGVILNCINIARSGYYKELR